MPAAKWYVTYINIIYLSVLYLILSPLLSLISSAIILSKYSFIIFYFVYISPSLYLSYKSYIFNFLTNDCLRVYKYLDLKWLINSSIYFFFLLLNLASSYPLYIFSVPPNSISNIEINIENNSSGS